MTHWEFVNLSDSEKDFLIEQFAKTLKDDETTDTNHARLFECYRCGFGYNDIYINDESKYSMCPNFCPNCGKRVIYFEFDD